MPRTISIFFCLILVFPTAALADDTVAAGEIGRGLLSPKADVRAKAQARLVARIEKGGDLRTFVKAMGDAVSGWANRSERLLEVWLHQAVHGTAEEREEAVRLLAALGEPAIRRLSLELRHELQHGGDPAPTRPRPPAAPAPQQEGQVEDAAVPAPPPTPVLPQIYKLGDLLDRGMNALELRGLLQKAADAVEVKDLGRTYIVTATQPGHNALMLRLDELRKSAKELDALREHAKKKPKPLAPKDEPAAPKAGEQDDADKHNKPKQNDGAPAPVPPAKPVPPGSQPLSFWRVDPVLVHLPKHAWTRANVYAAKGTVALPRVTPNGGIGVHVGTTQQSAGWAHAVRRVPDARSGGLAPMGSVPAGGVAEFFSGKEISYTSDVSRRRGGAWVLMTKTIPHGIGLNVYLKREAGRMRVDLTATRTDVGTPIPVVEFKPSENAAPIEIERPEWSTTRARASFALGGEGGGAFVTLDGLASGREQIVLVLTVTRATPQQSATGR